MKPIGPKRTIVVAIVTMIMACGDSKDQCTTCPPPPALGLICGVWQLHLVQIDCAIQSTLFDSTWIDTFCTIKSSPYCDVTLTSSWQPFKCTTASFDSTCVKTQTWDGRGRATDTLIAMEYTLCESWEGSGGCPPDSCSCWHYEQTLIEQMPFEPTRATQPSFPVTTGRLGRRPR